MGESSINVKEKEPWERFTIPNVKSKRLMYYNQLTKDIYMSAYRSKQSQFNAYLNGQRKFRWAIECNIEKLEQVVSSYKNGNIPKENINCTRYIEFPEDVKIEDVSKSQRALDHVKRTIKTINEDKNKLLKRKIELYGDNLEPKKWASNEIAFLVAKIAQIENMLTESEHIAHDIEHVCSLLRKRFDMASVNESERKRKAKRVKEQRSKSKKKRNMAKKSIKVDSDEDTDDVIDILDDEM